MIRRRIVPLALAVTGLLAVVALAAHGRPLSSAPERTYALPGAFWDYVFTSAVILFVVIVVGGLVAIVALRSLTPPERRRSRMLRQLALLIALAAVGTLVIRHLDLRHVIHQHPRAVQPAGPGRNAKGLRNVPSSSAREPHFRWEELAVVAGVLVLFGVGVAAARRRRGPTEREPAPEVLVAALDDSLDDLRSDPDLRRAIVAAYARMESALGAAGLPRRPAEAPLEYVERALFALEIRAEPVRTLTDLFEWARFSHHEPGPSMRDDAVDALVSIRDELRAETPVAA